MIAPRKVAIGMDKIGGSPRLTLRTAVRYPPRPIKKLLPRLMSPTKFARKSKATESIA